ncbi:radical SAM protein [Sorangium sp. So ce375]|uniref:radical SAM protein n=1 Tax=Sorangium sp. So ce375 TaxID=3133306 RepID=UPI003F5B3871
MPTATRPQNATLTGALPLDRPTAERPHRLYVATSNHCNRSCPWCCTCSSPRGQTFLALDRYLASFPAEGPFEVQLEGGEPTIHPHFDEMVRLARAEPRCARVVVVTNGVEIPRDPAGLDAWLQKLGEPATIKLSVNHHLLEHDDGLLALGRALRERLSALGGDRQLVLNVRLRKTEPDGDAWVVEAVRDAGLIELANVFHLQRYGFAQKREDWDEPFLVGTHFTMLNPDGLAFGPDLVARSDAMRRLP